jgi:hypothetical protein
MRRPRGDTSVGGLSKKSRKHSRLPSFWSSPPEPPPEYPPIVPEEPMKYRDEAPAGPRWPWLWLCREDMRPSRPREDSVDEKFDASSRVGG